ncbi:hypothetical protein LP420_28000 [Massilia sp. B-10]|nr:hypothetical protein LP420_28000 [Massilia sp. B-10]
MLGSTARGMRRDRVPDHPAGLAPRLMEARAVWLDRRRALARRRCQRHLQAVLLPFRRHRRGGGPRQRRSCKRCR